MSWLEEHFEHPYPDDNQKEELMKKTGLTINQINIWFVNSRMRVWKPRHHDSQITKTEPNSPNGNSDGSGSKPRQEKKIDMLNDELKSSLAARINPNNANLTRTNIVGSLPNGLPTPSTVICRGNLPKEAVDSLLKWLFDNFSHPYPSDAEKDVLAEETNLTLTQVNNWFINARRRIWKPILQKIKSKGMDKDELLSQGKLSEVAKSFYKDQKIGEEEPTKRKSKSSKGGYSSDHEESTPKKQKRDNSLLIPQDLMTHTEPTITRESTIITRPKLENNKSTHRELFIDQYRLSMENQKLEEDIHHVYDRYASVLENISEKNVKLLSHITLLEQKQQQIRLNNELLKKEVDLLRSSKVVNSNPFNVGSFLVEELGSSM